MRMPLIDSYICRPSPQLVNCLGSSKCLHWRGCAPGGGLRGFKSLQQAQCLSACRSGCSYFSSTTPACLPATTWPAKIREGLSLQLDTFLCKCTLAMVSLHSIGTLTKTIVIFYCFFFCAISYSKHQLLGTGRM